MHKASAHPEHPILPSAMVWQKDRVHVMMFPLDIGVTLPVLIFQYFTRSIKPRSSGFSPLLPLK
jgi:hypothetical protein